MICPYCNRLNRISSWTKRESIGGKLFESKFFKCENCGVEWHPKYQNFKND